jgi:DNA polymerase III subunit delta'
MKYKWPVLLHEKPLNELEEDLRQDRLSHAYLFDGPGEIGKTLVARIFAQILQCDQNFCRTCPTCRQIEKGQHIDTIELLDDGESLKIAQIRELLSHLSTTHSGRYKIVFIQNLDRIVVEAANTLLKTLEEPIPGVIFIITSTQSHRLLDTIISRARVISFHPMPEKSILDYIKERSDLDSSTLEMMAAFSMGRPGRAMKFLNDPDHFRFYQDIYHQIVKFFERPGVTQRMVYAETLAKDPDKIEAFFELFAHITRNFLLKKLQGSAVPYSFDQLFAIITSLNQARFELDHNLNARMVLEKFLITF